MKNSLMCLGAVLWWTAGLSAAETNLAPVRITSAWLDGLAEELRAQHPALKAAEARSAAAAANVASTRKWEDPTASVGFMAARTANRADDGDIIYGVEQKLPLFKKPEAARRVAEAEQAGTVAAADYQFQKLRLDLTRAALRVALAGREEALAREDLAWLDALAATIEELNRNGRGSAADLLRVNSDRARRADQRITAGKNLAHEQFVLNRLLNRGEDSAWAPLELPALAGSVPFTSNLLSLAITNEPRLRLMQREVDVAAANVNATRRQRLPDVSVGAEGRSYTGDGSLRSGTLLFSVSLPWGNREKYRADLEREQHRQRAVELEASDYTLTLREEIHRLVTAIDAARRQALLYQNEIIPRSEQLLATTRAQWESGRSPLREVFEVRRSIVEAQLGQAQAVAEQYQAMAEVAFRCGLNGFQILEHMAKPDAAANLQPR